MFQDFPVILQYPIVFTMKILVIVKNVHMPHMYSKVYIFCAILQIVSILVIIYQQHSKLATTKM